MRKINKIILVFIIAAELVVGGFVIINYINNSKRIYVTKIKGVQKEVTSSFSYYYEPIKNSEEREKLPWSGEEATYTLNNDGFNETKDYQVEKPQNTFRIIVLGDSFTFGQFINTKENWTELLETKLNSELENVIKIEVINLGVAGYDVPYIVETYQRRGKKYDPDLVVWFESSSGFFRNIEVIKPMIDECEKSSQYTEIELALHHNCWADAEIKIKEDYGIEKLSTIINQHFIKFFELVDSKRVIFIGFEDSFMDETQKQALKIRLEQYPQMNYKAMVPNIYELKEVFPDNHPNQKGQKTISDAVYEVIRPMITGSL